MNIVGIDFFCGVGGTSKGLQNAGIKVFRGIDNDPTCKLTYERNCSPSRFLLKDINKLIKEDVFEGLTLEKDELLLFAACAPCQPFSRHNRISTLDERANLIFAFSKILKDVIPDIIFIENVPGFVKASNGEIFKRFLEILDQLNFAYEWDMVDAKYYGVPQKRVRFVLIASQIGKIPFPKKTHGKNLIPFVTVRDIISKYPPLSSGESHSSISNHVARKLSDLNLMRMKYTPKNGGSRTSWPRDLWLNCHLGKHSGHNDVYGRMSWDKPAPTLTCKCNSLSNGRFGHPEQNRAISLREAAALQTFRDNFIFYDNSKTNIARHIGNAVPPLIAEIFGRNLVNYCNSSLNNKATNMKTERITA